jgi:protein SCO1/2
MRFKYRGPGAFLIVAGLAIVVAGFVYQTRVSIPHIDMPGVRMFSEPVTIMPFELQDHDGKTFDLSRLEGQWNVLFFGYTNCPDVCPTTLALMDGVAGRLPPDLQEKTQFVFVSVDPYRDKQGELKEFVRFFNPAFVGVTGTAAAIDQLAFQVGGIYDYEDPESHDLIRDTSTLGPDRDYLVSHFAGLMLIDPHARLVAHVLPPHDVDKVVEVISRLQGQG